MRRTLTAFLALMAVTGCAGRSGYVTSDLPRVAERVATWQQRLRDNDCPPGTTETVVHVRAANRVTSVGFQRARFEHKIVCAP